MRLYLGFSDPEIAELEKEVKKIQKKIDVARECRLKQEWGLKEAEQKKINILKQRLLNTMKTKKAELEAILEREIEKEQDISKKRKKVEEEVQKLAVYVFLSFIIFYP